MIVAPTRSTTKDAVSDDLETPIVFRAKLNNVRPLVNMLRAVGFRPRALCTISNSGLVFTVDEAQAMVAQAYLRTTLFSTFNYSSDAAAAAVAANQDGLEDEEQNEEEVTMQVSLPLDKLIECLTLFYGPGSGGNASSTHGIAASTLQGPAYDLRGATTVEIGYRGPGTDFELLLEESGIISTCRLATFEPDPAVDLEFARHPVVQQLIIKSEWLRDAFNELDPTSDAVSISISATEPYFRIATIGDNGSTEMTYARDERILDSYFCNEEMENRYKLQLILSFVFAPLTPLEMHSNDSSSAECLLPDSKEELLGSSDMDILFRNCRLSLRIPDSGTGRPEADGQTPWSVQEIAAGLPSKRQLFHGERAKAYVVATLPNVEQLRKTLASLMGRLDDQRLATNQLAISDSEVAWFFSRLQFDVAAYQAKATRTTGGEPGQLLRNVSSATAFVTHTGYSLKARVGRLDGGSLCCVYPLKIITPAPPETVEWPLVSALMVEIRAACRGVENEEPVAIAERAGDRSALLEELALRVSSDIFARSNDSRHGMSLTTDMDLTVSVLPRRMFQELLFTRPVVDVSTRVVMLPPSFGTDSALVEVTVRNQVRSSPDGNPSAYMELQTVKIESREWHVQPIGDYKLPFQLADESCWMSVYRISPLSRSSAEDALTGLHLINASNAETGLVARVNVSRLSTGDPNDEAQEFNVAHYFQASISEQQQHKSETAQHISGAPGSINSAESTATPNSASLPPLPSSRSDRSSAFLGASHMKTASIDHHKNAIHKYPLPFQGLHQAGDAHEQTSMPRVSARTERSDTLGGYPLTSPVGVRRQMLPWTEQRSRAATVNALSLVPRPSIVYPRASISTVQSAALSTTHHQGAHGLVLSQDLSKAEPRRVSLARRKPSLAPSFSTQPPQAQGPGASIGSIQLSFEAPAKVCLGQELTVRVYITNNTNTRYFRLCLVDVSADAGPSAGETDAAPRGLISMDHTTDVPPLRPGESTFVALQYIAAAPYFHAIRLLRLLNLDSDVSDKALVTIEAPFVVYIDDQS
ncbi:ssDNA endodeoxyribonuclease [Coemansia sp. RSA 1722]|nr:ssDNA endodeoxyribonuclease [Coemansia sp. RSA 1722]